MCLAAPALAANPVQVENAQALAANPVQVENAQAGDTYWQAALQDHTSSDPPIEGYADVTGVLPGGTIHFAVSASAGDRYRVEISRLGWYGGKGGRRITCLEGTTLDAECDHDEAAAAQPAPPAPDPVTGEVQAGWSMTDTLTVPADWTSGYYLAVFRVTAGPDQGQTGFTPFIVESPPGGHSAILVQVPTNTWNAYNTWGGEGIYTDPEAVAASFNRPYSHRLLFSWEYPLVRFLERGGWDVSYTTDDAVDGNPSILLGHALDMSAGHDEYWTSAMRTGWEAARDAGVNLAFMGADDANWQVRYEDDRRNMVAYKYLTDPVTDPSLTTTMFRWLSPARPECELMGVEFQGTVIPGHYYSYTADPAVATDPWFTGTGLSPGSVLTGLVGYETDAVTPGCHVPPVTPLLSYSGPAVQSNFGGAPTHSDAVRYTACSGAEVFATGSLQFSWGLDAFRDPMYASAPAPESPALEQVMTRALDDLTVSHVPRPGPPDICVPVPSLTVPAAAAVGQAVALESTSTDPYGVIGDQSWTLTGDGGAATMTGPTLTRTFARPGVADISLRVTDTSGAAAATASTVTICACPAPPTSGPWAPGTEIGGRCALTPFGALSQVGDRYWFIPDPGVRRFSVATRRLASATGAIGGGRVTRRTARRPVALAAPVPGRPIEVDISAPIAGRSLRERFLIPQRLRSGRPARPQPLTAVTCDGSAGQILTPAFGGPRSQPLRVAVTGDGRLTVTLSGPGGRARVRRVPDANGRMVVLSWPSTRLRGGTYTVTVRAPGSWLPQPFALRAARLPARRTGGIVRRRR